MIFAKIFGPQAGQLEERNDLVPVANAFTAASESVSSYFCEKPEFFRFRFVQCISYFRVLAKGLIPLELQVILSKHDN